MSLRDRNGKNLTWEELAGKLIMRLYSYWEDLVLLWLGVVTWVPSHIVRKSIYKMCGLKLDWSSTVHVGCRFFNPSGVEIGKDSIIGDR